MTILRSLGEVAAASGDEAIDWAAVTAAAKAATPRGTLVLGPDERSGLADDVRAAGREIRAASGLPLETPGSVDVQDRHHWIGANVDTFRRVLAPLAEGPVVLPGLTTRANTATMAAALAVLSRHVLGQYDPALFGGGEPRLSVVDPNLRRGATLLSVEPELFRRWIVFHEVAHAAEFQAAPWLVGHLEERIERAVGALADGAIDTETFREVDATMTVVEGYAEFLMDRAFDAPVDDLRAKLDARRRAGGPLVVLVRRLLGLGIKRRQYERGRAFFEAVAAARGARGAGAVWREADALPTRGELDSPQRWIDRVDP